MSKRDKTKAPESPAPAKAESPRTSAAAPATKPGPVFSGRPPDVVKDGNEPLMSAGLSRPDEPNIVPGRFDGAVQSAHEWGDTSDLAAIGRTATAAELAEFRKTIEARRKAERDQPRPADTFWVCKSCGYECRMGADQRKAPSCFRCNPMLSPSGSHMAQLTAPAEVDGFIEREKREREAFARALAKAKEIARKRDQENTLLRKAGL